MNMTPQTCKGKRAFLSMLDATCIVSRIRLCAWRPTCISFRETLDTTCWAAQGRMRLVRELGERYTAPLPSLARRITQLKGYIAAHLKRMGFA